MLLSDGGFSIAGVMVAHLHSDMADELLRVYRKIVPMYAGLLDQFCSGPLMALIIVPGNSADPDVSIVPSLRDFTGPNNCELAALLRPKSIRAKLGTPGIKTNIIENGAHCTDLEDDGFMECSYFFRTIASIKQHDY